MKVSAKAADFSAATAVVIVGLFIGCPGAAAQPGDYSALPIDPNSITDSTAYSSAPATQKPNGQPGVAKVFTHRDSTRQITDTILVLPDAAAAASALEGSKAVLGSSVVGGTPQPAAVGTGGTVVSGSSPDGSESVTVLLFTQGNAVTTVEFAGPPTDPVPLDLVIEFGQAQDTAIKNQLGP